MNTGLTELLADFLGYSLDVIVAMFCVLSSGLTLLGSWATFSLYCRCRKTCSPDSTEIVQSLNFLTEKMEIIRAEVERMDSHYVEVV